MTQSRPLVQELAQLLELDEIFFQNFNDEVLSRWIAGYKNQNLSKQDIENFIFLLKPRAPLPAGKVLEKLKQFLPARISKRVKDHQKVYRRVVRQALAEYQREVGTLTYQTIQGTYPTYLVKAEGHEFRITIDGKTLVLKVEQVF